MPINDGFFNILFKQMVVFAKWHTALNSSFEKHQFHQFTQKLHSSIISEILFDKIRFKVPTSRVVFFIPSTSTSSNFFFF